VPLWALAALIFTESNPAPIESGVDRGQGTVSSLSTVHCPPSTQSESIDLRIVLGYGAAAIAALAFVIPDFSSVPYAFVLKRVRAGQLPPDSQVNTPSLQGMFCLPDTYSPARLRGPFRSEIAFALQKQPFVV